MVLPIFDSQVGVQVDYKALPHKITLTLKNVPWKDALAQVCDAAQTHLERSEKPGRLEMRNDYEDPRPVLKGFEPKKPPPEKDDSPNAGGGN